MDIVTPLDAHSDKPAALTAALSSGIITREEHDRQLSEVVPPGPVIPSTRVIAGRTKGWKVYNKGWSVVDTLSTFAEANGHRQAGKYGRYVWHSNPGKPGDRRFKCNGHVNCEVRPQHSQHTRTTHTHTHFRSGCGRQVPLRIKENNDGDHEVAIYSGLDHTLVQKNFKGKRSSLSQDMEELVTKEFEKGVSPACI